jgi:hypothetical protein
MIERYKNLFVNRTDAFAVQSQNGQAYRCVKRELTDREIRWHLEGAETLAFYNLGEDNKVKWGALDIDVDEEGIFIAQDTHRRLSELGIPSYLEESRNQRAHLWVFTPSWPARAVRTLLSSVVEEEGVEIFPKQDSLSPGSLGFHLRGPLGIHKRTYEWYGFLDPDSLERISNSHEYLSTISLADQEQLAGALNELLRTDRIKHLRAEKIFPAQAEIDTLAAAEVLKIPLERKGKYLTGVCPFHPNASKGGFSIYTNTNIWVCWHEHRMGKGGESLYAAVKGIPLDQAQERLKELL